MLEYNVFTTEIAEDDILRNTDYIAFEKLSPETAMELGQGLRKAIECHQLMYSSFSFYFFVYFLGYFSKTHAANALFTRVCKIAMISNLVCASLRKISNPDEYWGWRF